MWCAEKKQELQNNQHDCFVVVTLQLPVTWSGLGRAVFWERAPPTEWPLPQPEHFLQDREDNRREDKKQLEKWIYNEKVSLPTNALESKANFFSRPCRWQLLRESSTEEVKESRKDPLGLNRQDSAEFHGPWSTAFPCYRGRQWTQR